MNRVLFASIIVGIAVMLSTSTIPSSYGGGTANVVVPLDIKPESCPNPLNVNSEGVLPVAIVGDNSFDIEEIDLGTIRLEGIEPLRSELEDVATPFGGELEDEDSCTEAGPDGIVDLAFKFSTQDIVAALGGVNDGDVIILTLTGEFDSGDELLGQDIIIIIKK